MTHDSPVVVGTSTGNDFPNGRAERYTYSSGFGDEVLNHNILTRTLPREVATGGPPALIWTYGTDPGDPDSYDRVTQRVRGGLNDSGVDAGGTMTLAYETLNASEPPGDRVFRRKVTHTDRKGNVTEYFFNERNSEIFRRELTRGLRLSEPVAYETESFYDNDGQLIRRIFPAGNEIRYTYGSTSREARRNLVEKREVADAARGGGEDIVTTIEYEPLYQQVRRVVDPRGNDSTFDPSLGDTSPERFATTIVFDYQESTDPIPDVSEFGLDIGSVDRGLGDQNSDGRVDQYSGNPVRIIAPSAQLRADSLEAARLGTTTQEVITETQWNDAGQRVAEIDAEGQVTTWEYFPEDDPDGDGEPTFTLFKPLSANPTGYKRAVVQDATTSPRRRTPTPPTALRTEWTYDEVGNLLTETNPRGVRTDFEFNQLNELVSVTGGADVSEAVLRGQLLTGELAFAYRQNLHFNANGQLVRTETENRDSNTTGVGAFVERTFDYDILKNRVQATVEVDAGTTLVTEFRYDANENPTLTVAPEGTQERTFFDERDFPFLMTWGAGGIDPALDGPDASTLRVDYDLNGNRSRITDAEDNDGDGDPEHVDYVYDGFDRQVEVRDALGNVKRLTYDPAGNRTSLLEFGHPANQPGATNVLLASTVFHYDELSRPYQTDMQVFVSADTSLLRPAVLSDGNSDGWVTLRTEFDAIGRVVGTVDDDDEPVVRAYDGANRLISRTDVLGNQTRYTYDQNSNPIEVTSFEVSPEGLVPPEFFTTRYVYDQLDRLHRATDNAGQTTYFGYDSRDNLVFRADPEGLATSDPLGVFPGPINAPGNTQRTFYDGFDRVVRQVSDLRLGGTGSGALDLTNGTNPDGQVSMTFVWDGNSRLVARSDDNGNTTRWTYDEQNRPKSEVNADGTSTAFTYDRDHNLRVVTDPNGTRSTRTYDALHRLVEVTVQRASGVAGTTQETYQYDGLSRLTRATDDNGNVGTTQVSEFAYDSLSRMLEERFNGEAVSNVWRGDGARLKCTYASGREIAMSYDAIDRVKTLQDVTGSTTELIAESDWIGPGYRELRREFGNGTAMTFLNDAGNQDVGYDAVKRMVRLRHLGPGGSSFVDREYGYNRANARVFARRHDDSGLTDTYSYDSLYRLRAADLDTEGTAAATKREQQRLTFLLDGVGNWRERGVVDRATSNTDLSLFAVNEMNEFISETRTPAAGSPTTTSRTHDENGNLLGDERRAYVYDYLNRLVAVFDTLSGNPVATYHYYPGGRRAEKTVYSQTSPGVVEREVRYVYDGDQVCEEQDAGGAALVTFVYSPVYVDAVVQFERTTSHPLGAGTFFAHANARFDVVAITDDTGAVVERRTYDPFGRAYDESKSPVVASAVGNPYGFQGRRIDSESGLHYFRARYYDASTGRFLQRDPAWDSSNLGNAYTFAGNSPFYRGDPTGTTAAQLADEVDSGVDWIVGWVQKKLDVETDNVAVAALSGFYQGLAEGAGDLVKGGADALRFGKGLGEASLKIECGDYMGAAASVGEDLLRGASLAGAAGSGVRGLKTAAKALNKADNVTDAARSGHNVADAASTARGRCNKPGGNCFVAGTFVALGKGGFAEIQDVILGQRVASRESGAPPEVPIVSDRTYQLVLTMPNPDGSDDVVEIRLLRSTEWVAEHCDLERGTVFLEFKELGLVGDARIEAVQSCPRIEPGEGRVVTGTFTHLNSYVIQLTIEEVGRLEPTRQHPFFSVDRVAWVPAQLLWAGERIATQAGPRRVLALSWKAGTHRVHNLEVEGTHTYFVSETEQDPAVWVHNTCEPGGAALPHGRSTGPTLQGGEPMPRGMHPTTPQAQGRQGRAENLWQYEANPDMPRHVRGWMRQERVRAERAAQRGELLEPRTPPGYVQAHGRTTPAREGYDYGNSRLQGTDLNRLEERVRRRHNRR